MQASEAQKESTKHHQKNQESNKNVTNRHVTGLYMYVYKEGSWFIDNELHRTVLDRIYRSISTKYSHTFAAVIVSEIIDPTVFAQCHPFQSTIRTCLPSILFQLALVKIQPSWLHSISMTVCKGVARPLLRYCFRLSSVVSLRIWSFK